MRHYTLKDSPEVPVSHDPSLIKRLLVEEGGLPGLKGLSHIVMPAGASVGAHSHPEGYEVFYCIRGNASVLMGDASVTLGPGHCLVVEPGEPHGFEVMDETELLYLFLLKQAIS